MKPELLSPLRIGVDVGGTFTDVVVLDAAGVVRAVKSPSNPPDPAAGVLAALELTARQLDRSVSELLGACGLFVHGSTVATNVLLEKKGARTAMLCTEGFRDSLEIRRGLRADVWDHRAPMPQVLVPRYWRFGIPGRLDAKGHELAPLDEQALIDVARTLAEEKIESVAICFLHSYTNPSHEYRAKEILQGLLAEVSIHCSADVAPILGEYERSSTTAVNAYVGPRVIPYLKALDEKLSVLGLPNRMLLVQSNGGAASVEELARRPVQMVLSGPSAGVGSMRFYGADIGSENLMSIEVGGTSCDVMLSVNGHVSTADQLVVDGYHLSMPAVEIHTVGAGGGTIAHVDAAGLLHAGPEGAGARPGPAAYGLGGVRPTVTDAQLVLGRLRPGPYAGGAISLDLERATAAMEEYVARPLGIGIHEAAAGMLRLVEQNIRHAVEKVSTEHGCNPRNFTLIAAGGAGPLHGATVARTLGCQAAYIPRLAGVFCAFGMCNADVRYDYLRSWLGDLDADDDGALSKAFGSLMTQSAPVLAHEGFEGGQAEFRQGMDLRYQGQQSSINIETPTLDRAAIRAAFSREHVRLFGYEQPAGRIEITNLRLSAFGRTAPVRLQLAPTIAGDPLAMEMRQVWDETKRSMRATPVYDGKMLRAGHCIDGPAVIDEPSTTILINQGDRLLVTDASNYLVEIY